MQRHITVNLGNLILSLSDAMDLASPLLIQHQQRVAHIAWEMTKAANFQNGRKEQVFIAALLHDIGAFSLDEKISLQSPDVEKVEDHCIRGELLLNNVPWLKESSIIIRHHHREWQNWVESIDNSIVLDSQILFIADFIERQIKRDQYILHQHEDIISTVKSLSGSQFHPEVVDLFITVCNSEEFWLDLISPRLYSILLNEGPFKGKEIGFSNLLSISELFRNIIDFRSRFTSTHSSGVAASASILARIFGFTDMEIRLMEIAGNLHDIGKLFVSNSILDKPAKLTKEEMAIMKSHAYYTYHVINTIGGLKQIAEWAAYHHEKLDGSGYPFHCTETELTTGARIMMVADIFTALAEDRPYKKGMSQKSITQIFKQFSDRHLLDGRIINLLLENYEEIASYTAEKQTAAREFYEKQFTSIQQ